GVVGHVQHGAHLNCHRESPYQSRASARAKLQSQPATPANQPRQNRAAHSSYFVADSSASGFSSGSVASDDRRMISSSVQRFSFDRGRVSRMRTTSPI